MATISPKINTKSTKISTEKIKYEKKKKEKKEHTCNLPQNPSTATETTHGVDRPSHNCDEITPMMKSPPP